MLADTFAEIRKSLSSYASARAFDEGAAHHTALAVHRTPLDILAAVAATSPLTVEERDAILVALLNELHRTRHPIWQSILVLAFEPLLVRLRARLGKPKAVCFGRSMGADLDQRVLLAPASAAVTRSERRTSPASMARGVLSSIAVFMVRRTSEKVSPCRAAREHSCSSRMSNSSRSTTDEGRSAELGRWTTIIVPPISITSPGKSCTVSFGCSSTSRTRVPFELPRSWMRSVLPP